MTVREPVTAMETRITSMTVVALLLSIAACSTQKPPEAQVGETQVSDAAESWSPQAIDRPHLPNAYRLHPKVISGGLPDGEEGFRELSELGVKTVISVDGAKPDVDSAQKYQLRYVHLPHGYDGVPEERAQELAKAVRDLPGPIYIHCHHGKHRSPAAATVACVGSGLLEADLALSVLRTAGTSENYLGLYESAKSARRFEDDLLDALEAEFPETVDVPPMAEAMVAIERTFDRLQAFSSNDWQPLEEHPDLDAAHEALQLREHFTELLRTEEAQRRPAGFVEALRESELAATDLETALRQRRDSAQPVPSAAHSSLDRLAADCKSCHRQHRDVPLSEKQRP